MTNVPVANRSGTFTSRCNATQDALSHHKGRLSLVPTTNASVYRAQPGRTRHRNKVVLDSVARTLIRIDAGRPWSQEPVDCADIEHYIGENPLLALSVRAGFVLAKRAGGGPSGAAVAHRLIWRSHGELIAARFIDTACDAESFAVGHPYAAAWVALSGARLGFGPSGRTKRPWPVAVADLWVRAFNAHAAGLSVSSLALRSGPGFSTPTRARLQVAS